MKKEILFGVFISTMMMASCKKEEGPKSNPIAKEPILLPCDYFSKNPGTTLTNDPDAEIDYIVTCKMAISSDIKIEPGTVIQFESDAGFNIQATGSLAAIGEEKSKILFTGKTKLPGAWAGIFVRSNNVRNELTHCVIEYAGGSAFNSNGDLGGVIVYAASRLRMKHNEFKQNAAFGLNANYISTQFTLENNRFVENEQPISITGVQLGMLNASNSFLENQLNKIAVHFGSADISDPTIWSFIGIPYAVRGGNTMTVSSDLTIEPGVEIEMGNAAGIKVVTKGSLKMVGTETKRIKIRGNVPQAGSWNSIEYHFSTSPNNEIKYADIEHGGGNPSVHKGAIYMWAGPKLIVSHSNFANISSCAFYAAPKTNSPNPNLEISNNVTFENCGGEVCGD